MDSFELNKIAGAVLFTLMMTVGLSIVAEEVFSSHKPAKLGYELADAAPAGQAAEAPVADPPLAEVLVKASVDKGQTIFRKCTACHTVAKGAKPAVGPNLWGVIGGPKAHEGDFAYSASLKERGEKGEKWTPEDFYQFIKAPQSYVPGTKMTFIGLPNPQDRADVLSYLDKQSDSPAPLPTK